MLAPRRNTWSRSARRQATRAIRVTESESNNPSENTDSEVASAQPLMRLCLYFMTPAALKLGGTVSVQDEDLRGATLSLDFLEGRDRPAMEAFWMFLLTKAGLVGRAGPSSAGGRGRDIRTGNGKGEVRNA